MTREKTTIVAMVESVTRASVMLPYDVPVHGRLGVRRHWENVGEGTTVAPLGGNLQAFVRNVSAQTAGAAVRAYDSRPADRVAGISRDPRFRG
jgi:hypothetical protein